MKKTVSKTVSTSALYFIGPGIAEVRREEIQQEPGEVIVTSELMGISHGTEMLFFLGELDAGTEMDDTLASIEGGFRYPVRYGYSNAGTTSEGTRVFGFFPHQSHFSAQPEDLIELPEGLGFEEAIFLPNLETALSLVQDFHLIPGDSVLIIGLGIVGLLVVEVLQRSHYGKLFAVDPIPKRRAAAAKLGCLVLESNEDLAKTIIEHTEGRGVDRALNVSGSYAGLQNAVDSIAFEGEIIEGSWYGRKASTLHLGTEFHRRRIIIRSSQVSSIPSAYRGRWDKKRRLSLCIDLMQTIKPGKYITQSYPLERAQEAFDQIAEHPEETIQVVLTP